MEDNTTGKAPLFFSDEDIPLDQIPAELQIFAGKTPAQMFACSYTPEQVEKLAAMMVGIGFDIGIPLPEFARAASKQFWKYYFGNNFNPNNSIKDFGQMTKLFDLANELPKSGEKKPFDELLLKALPVFVQMITKGIEGLPDEEKANYFAGRAKGKRVIEKLDSDYLKMVKRAPIYLLIAAAWRIFEAFKSQAEAERWMRANKIIGRNFESSEIRAVFRQIGLRYRGQGRPKKSEKELPAPTKKRIR